MGIVKTLLDSSHVCGKKWAILTQASKRINAHEEGATT
jgi:hypothetical protein